jgi:hypothetical protein
MKKIFLNLSLASIMIAIPANVLATEFLNPEDKGFIADSVYNDDVFIAGNNLKFDSKVGGDLFAACNEIVQSEAIDGNFNGFCQSIQSLGPIGGSFRFFGRFISCNAPIGRNVIAFGQEITIGPNCEIGHDAHLFAAKVNFQGRANGDLDISAGQASLLGSVAGCFCFEGGSLVIGPNAVIEGDLIYETPEKADISTSARITGEVKWTRTERKEREESGWITFGKISTWLISHRGYFLFMTVISLGLFIGSAIPFPAVMSMIILWIMLAISGNILILLSKSMALRTEQTLSARLFPSLGFGFVILLLAPIVSVVLLLTIIGAPLGAVLILLFGAGCFAGGIYASLFIGRKIFELLGISRGRPCYLCFTIGMVILVALSFIPIVGYLLSMLVIMTGLGGLTLALFSGLNSTENKPPDN